MAELQFPAAPSDGDTYLDYVYDSALDVWQKYSSAVSLGDVTNVVLPESVPDNSFISFDAASSTWGYSSEQLIPAGVVIPYPGDGTPDGYLRCDGSIKLRADYARLFTAIGTTYNLGDETSLQFRLPNLIGRVAVGKDDAQSEFTPLGKSGGSKTYQLSLSELPSHTHVQDPHTHYQNPHNHGQDSHSHSSGTPFSNAGSPWGLGYFGSFRGRVGVTGGWGLGTDGRQPAIWGNTASNQDATAENEYTGGNQPHNNLQPYITLDYVIKY